MPPYKPVHEAASPEAHLSFAIGVALGRFGANGEGILSDPPSTSLPDGLLFVTPNATPTDSLHHPACKPLHAAWEAYCASVGTKNGPAERDPDLGTYLRKTYFAQHKKEYENRPIYFALSSAKKSYVCWVSIHRWRASTLHTVLAEHLVPEKRRLEGELKDSAESRAKSTAKSAAEKRYNELSKLREELAEFIDSVAEIADRGAPPSEKGGAARERDNCFEMDLDDGVMVNSAALWTLLDPQWKDPKKWWKELCAAKGRKDYDWSHLAARYFAKRVEAKCVEDPSLAVAHKCFWRLHPAKAYAWELRLQQEISKEFVIDEPDAKELRAKWLKAHAAEAKELRESEAKRAERKAAKEGDGDAEGEAELPGLDGDESE